MVPLTDAQGRVYTAPGAVPVAWNAGIGYTATGQICTTQTLGANDSYNGAWRVDPLGRVVVAVLSLPTYFAGGMPFTAAGALVGQPNVAPGAGDSFVRGIRVGPDGVFGTTSPVP